MKINSFFRLQKLIKISSISFGFFLVGEIFFTTSCGKPEESSVVYVNPETNQPKTLALEYRDFKNAALALLNSMLQSPALQHCGKDGKPCVIAIATIKNDTTQYIDIDQLLSDIKQALLQSGRFVISAAVSTTDKDKMLEEIRKLRNNPEFNKTTIPGKGTLVAPQYLLSGKIIQKNYFFGDKKYVEYYFILKLIDTRTGNLVWEGKKIIAKMGSKNTPTW